MGWFGWYAPADRLNCPVCGEPLLEWQGHEGPCARLVWRQFTAAPVDQRVDPELRPLPWPQPHWLLPTRFSIQSHDCGCPYPVEAFGHTESGVWWRTELVTLAKARQRKHETRAEWAARRRWLAGR